MTSTNLHYVTRNLPMRGEADARARLFPERINCPSLNLPEGLYAVESHGGHTRHCRLTPSTMSGDGTRTRSYFAVSPGEDFNFCCNQAGYLWDTPTAHSRITRARELLPFEKIELMFLMQGLCNVKIDRMASLHDGKRVHHPRNVPDYVWGNYETD